jgi:hypothetical protein
MITDGVRSPTTPSVIMHGLAVVAFDPVVIMHGSVESPPPGDLAASPGVPGVADKVAA